MNVPAAEAILLNALRSPTPVARNLVGNSSAGYTCVRFDAADITKVYTTNGIMRTPMELSTSRPSRISDAVRIRKEMMLALRRENF